MRPFLAEEPRDGIHVGLARVGFMVQRDRYTGIRGVQHRLGLGNHPEQLDRPDVLPLGDVGLVNGATRLYGWDQSGSMRERTSLLQDHAELWRPWRTVATWYIWRDIDAEPVVY